MRPRALLHVNAVNIDPGMRASMNIGYAAAGIRESLMRGRDHRSKVRGRAENSPAIPGSPALGIVSAIGPVRTNEQDGMGWTSDGQ